MPQNIIYTAFKLKDAHLPLSSVDVNVTPDKRKLMLRRETESALLAALSSALRGAFEGVSATFEVAPAVAPLSQ